MNTEVEIRVKGKLGRSQKTMLENATASIVGLGLKCRIEYDDV